MRSSRIHRSFPILALALASPVIAALAGDDPTPIRPVAVWAAGPLDVTLAFQEPVQPTDVFPGGVKTIRYYDGDGGGDATSPLGSLNCPGVRASEDGRVLTMATDPHPVAARYVIGSGEITYDLGGVEISWFEGDQPDDEPEWTGWLPTLDPAASQKAMVGSVPHARWFADMAKTGHLRLETQARLPEGTNRLTIESSAPITECFSSEGEPENGVEKTGEGGGRAVFAVADPSHPLFLSLTIQTGGAVKTPPTVRASFFVEGKGEAREPSREQLLLPWAVLPVPSPTVADEPVPDLSGGDPARGEAVFFSDEALCFRCHLFDGRGGTVGPDLSDGREKTPESLYRSIAAPSEEIAPEYVSYTVSLKDGRVVVGVARAEGIDALRVTDSDAKETIVPRAEIDEIRPVSSSIMPVGLLPVLGEAKVRDLIAFLRREAGRVSGEEAKPAP